MIDVSWTSALSIGGQVDESARSAQKTEDRRKKAEDLAGTPLSHAAYPLFTVRPPSIGPSSARHYSEFIPEFYSA